MVEPCPTPHKRSYRTRTIAKRAAQASEETFGHRFYCYFCKCKTWHLTTMEKAHSKKG